MDVKGWTVEAGVPMGRSSALSGEKAGGCGQKRVWRSSDRVVSYGDAVRSELRSGTVKVRHCQARLWS